jgi:hypothetical protein
MSDAVYSGGCQCGAVRFRVRGHLGEPSICHCRMCQKAFGNYYAPLVGVRDAEFAWTRGEPKYFQSSNHVRRGFCANCGTPLSFVAPDGLGLAIGAFDEPGRIRPVVQFGVEAKIDYVDHLHELRGEKTEADLEAAPYLADIVNYQHPDHDTSEWCVRAAPEPDHWRPKEEGV